MALTRKTPGVYVEEVSTLPPSVAEVSTAIPVFIGYTEKALQGNTSVLKKSVRVSTMLEYENIFGSAATVPFAVEVNTDANTNISTITSATPETLKFFMHYSLRMFFDNGGGSCYIVSVGTYGDDSEEPATAVKLADIKTGLDIIALEDEPTLIVCPDAVNLPSSEYNSYATAALRQCSSLGDRFAIFDVINASVKELEIRSTVNDAAEFRDNAVGTENLKYGAVYYPNLLTILTYNYKETGVTVNETKGDADPESFKLNSMSSTRTGLYNQIKAYLDTVRVELAPSSAIAGAYASVDNNRGVWKAPANVSLASVISPTIKISDDQQDDLNVDSSAGKSVNVIRSFTGKGTLIWGARTLAGNDNEWRYVSVRRLFILIEESLRKATAYAVFEANTALTWLKLSTLIESFLTNLWQRGALAGSTPEQAFFVNVGLGKSMTAQDILEGRLIIEIGIAAVRPAEFITLRFSHKLQES
ncbi:MAG: hypothetical protein K0S11_298 [Gammaproteobacteria bacterium]|nr:hypothetical protein [Gammaproteobacteria bacterium]